MPAGTIALTNNSTSVTGSGTSFKNELKANDFIFAIVGGTPYTLGIASVNSDTSITLTVAYKGPSNSGAAWNAIPNQTLVGIVAEMATQTAYAIRGLNYDKDNWQGIYSDAASVTVTRPDMSTYTGPSWGYLSNSLSNKPNSSDVLLKVNNTITRYSNGAIRVNDGVYEMSFLAGGGAGVGQFNPQTIGGITFYTHFYKIALPRSMPNGILVANAILSGDRFGNQNPGYNADIKVSRDKDDGSGLLTDYVTISVKTPQTGWVPYFHITVVGY